MSDSRIALNAPSSSSRTEEKHLGPLLLRSARRDTDARQTWSSSRAEKKRLGPLLLGAGRRGAMREEN
jgi:hypothetical protein